MKKKIKEIDEIYKAAILTKKLDDWERYKSTRSILVDKIKEAKNSYYFKVIDNNEQNSQEHHGKT